MKAEKGKILYTSSSISPQSGAYRQMLSLKEAVEGRGWETCLVLPEPPAGPRSFPVAAGGADYLLPLPEAKAKPNPLEALKFAAANFPAVRRLARIIREERVDIVHVNEFYDLYAGASAWITGRKCVWHVRADFSDHPLIHYLIPRILLLLADRIVVVSRSVENRVFLDQGLRSKKILRIPDPGPDPAVFHPGVNPAAVREELGIEAGQPVVSLVAKLSRRKGHETLIRAVPRVLDAHPGAVFLVVGGELDGVQHREYARRLRAIPEELRVEERVLFTGYRADIFRVMAASDLVVHCSTYADPFPGVVLQAMAAGKPVIASNRGGTGEQIESGVSGLLVDPGDPRALAQAVNDLLADRFQRERMGAAGRRRVRTVFAGEKYFDRLTQLYAELLEVGDDE